MGNVWKNTGCSCSFHVYLLTLCQKTERTAKASTVHCSIIHQHKTHTLCLCVSKLIRYWLAIGHIEFLPVILFQYTLATEAKIKIPLNMFQFCRFIHINKDIVFICRECFNGKKKK